jgi:hypothetical protein
MKKKALKFVLTVIQRTCKKQKGLFLLYIKMMALKFCHTCNFGMNSIKFLLGIGFDLGFQTKAN